MRNPTPSADLDVPRACDSPKGGRPNRHPASFLNGGVADEGLRYHIAKAVAIRKRLSLSAMLPDYVRVNGSAQRNPLRYRIFVAAASIWGRPPIRPDGPCSVWPCYVRSPIESNGQGFWQSDRIMVSPCPLGRGDVANKTAMDPTRIDLMTSTTSSD